MNPSARAGRDWLAIAAGAFLAANLLHGFDHQRQGTERLTTEVMAGGALLTVMAVVTLVVVRRGGPRAALFATLVGFWAALNVSAAHIAPHWSALSDSYLDVRPDALAWAVMLLEVGTALALGAVGARRLSRTAGRGRTA